MGSAQYNKLSSSATTESGPDHTLDLEQNPGSTFSEQAHTGGATAASGFTEANVAIDEGPDYDQQKHKMGLSKLIKGLRRTAMGRLHFRRARGPGTLKRVTILALLITVLLVVFRYYHTTTVAINQWRYHEDPRNDLAKSVINILSSSENKLVELNLDKTMLKRPEKKRLSKWRHKYTMTTFDPRLPASLYVSKLADYLESHESSLDPTLELEFSWKDWTDFNRRLLPSDKYLSAHHGQPIENCQQFIDETGFSNPQTCRDLTADEINTLPDATYPHFKITGVSDPRIARDARVLMAGTYLYYTMPAPERIVFVDTGSKRALSVRTVESGGRKPLLDTLVSEFKRSHAETEEISISEQMERLNSAIDKTTLGSDSEKYADLDVLKVIPERVDRENSPVDLSTDMFQWEENADDVKRAAQGKLEQIESKCRGENNAAVKARDTISPNDDSLKELTCNPKYSNMLRLNSELVEFITANPNNGYPKFFHEAGYTPIGHDNGAHLDWRFISSRKLPEYESKSGLHRLMR